MKILSPEFVRKGMIPSKYTCDELGISPPLKIENIPSGTKSVALIVDDPDAPSGDFVHWLIANIDPVGEIGENSIPEGSVQGKNSAGKIGYIPPCPSSGTHRYCFKLYALSSKLNLNEGYSKTELLSEIKKTVIAQAELIGLYCRIK